MTGSGVTVGVLAVTAVVGASIASVGAASLVATRVTNAADAAALAAADTASGFAAGDPCTRAADLAEANGVTLASCAFDGAVATVSVASSFGPFAVTATARAGPPP